MMCFIHEWNSLHVHRVSEKKLDSLLFHHIFALTAMNSMNIFRSTLLLVVNVE